jgi:16S rRNA (cytidine1402-2'-O)-methyltransferase|tara:strand:- start:546 stop:1223 length:678 start_codon:yes stop_codon:yes gene_type:complete
MKDTLVLFIIPTPIGNLEDITYRAVKVLQNSDYILCEDTRVSKKLLTKYNIKKPLFSYHSFNEHKVVNKHIDEILSGKIVSLISDAGTPSISDPGFLIIREAIKSNIEIDCLPGATAFVPSLVNSGLSSDKFIFEGFLPTKKGRKKRLKFLSNENRTIIIYESPKRILRTLKELILFLGKNRKASVSRELTKIYQENIRGTLEELITIFDKKVIKGEIVLIVDGE